MTTDTQVSASVDSAQAVTATEPSNPVNEAKETEAPEGEAPKPEGKPEPTEAQKLEEKFQKRIARQTAANREQQRQLQEATKRIAEYEAKLAAVKPLDDKPSQENFETLEEYTDALADWKVSQKQKAEADKAKEPSVDELADQKIKTQQAEAAFRSKEDEFRKATPDYDKATEVVNGLLAHVNPNHPSTQAFATALLSAPNPPALVHYLGTHPDVAIKMMQQSAFEIQDSIAEIIDSLDAPKPIPQTAELPQPPSGLKGSTKVSKPLHQQSGRELLERFAK